MKTKPYIKPLKSKLSLKNILVPIDFSNHSRKALEYAVPLAAQNGARITLLHVVGKMVVYPTEMSTVIPDEKETIASAHKHLAALAQKSIPGSLRGKVLIHVGDPFDEITRLAKQLKAGLIICTTHGYTGLAHVLLGSTAERIVRHAPCPVLTIKVR
ncbi:MAG TPA: universal stress protein [Candidatus Sulfotelmatobacter sp.]|jgi:universal stress protein A|nr:universal stress protein [Candidatus Sulfotelmatobacter sp.]